MASILSAGTSSGTALNLTGDTSGILQLASNNGTVGLTMDTSQNIGIGTTSPAYKLDVSQNIAGEGAIQITNANAGTSVISEFRASNGTNFALYGIGGTGYSTYAQIRANAAVIYSNTSAGVGISSDNASGYITFGTGSSAPERMRIDSSGNLLVGTTTSAGGSAPHVKAALGINTRSGQGGSYGGNLYNLYWTGSAMQLWVDSSNLGNISVTSDYRIKRNVETQTTPALERIMALRPVTYQMANYGDLFKASDDIKEGFIAHEVQEIIPSGAEGVKDAENQIQSLRLDALCSVMVKAIQEQQALITTLQTQVAALQAKVGV